MATESPAQAVLDGGDTGWLEEFYRDLHRHPELSHQEHRTASKVAERLGEWGFEKHTGVGGTGVIGLLRNGSGPTVLLRADMDALPVREATGLPYASTATTGGDPPTPVMHACGHDVHVTCLLGAAQLLAEGTGHWSGTVIALFQPAEETADGARGMVEDGLRSVIPAPDVALAQHVLPLPAGRLATGSGPVLAAADSVRITVHGSGGHGSMPHTTIDPVVVAAMIVVRLQTVVAREVPPGEQVVLTVGSVQAGTKSNVIPDTAVLELNIRTYGEQIRTQVLDAIDRIVRAECAASRCPKEPEFEMFARFPLTENDHDVTERVTGALREHFGADQVGDMGRWSASEDFGELPAAFDAPSTFWALGGIDPDLFERAAREGRVAQDVPGNHSAKFAPVPQPTLDAGTRALVVAALACLSAGADR
ncbi:amidohydrolase [Saccharopolyspora sp. NFXS83]|uniref:amidohydrolase n=1 Tax=Saccharopolyspora sp. NFXS83 TaxID=2993560 RepID=UPI00224A7B2F|nr:amidohydrolase [Saccharopolyspora sp. NFXS83]MCX2730121.1 amidohydrolase [Saccharopolyspora sp. NFXS83]